MGASSAEVVGRDRCFRRRDRRCKILSFRAQQHLKLCSIIRFVVAQSSPTRCSHVAEYARCLEWLASLTPRSLPAKADAVRLSIVVNQTLTVMFWDYSKACSMGSLRRRKNKEYYAVLTSFRHGIQRESNDEHTVLTTLIGEMRIHE